MQCCILFRDRNDRKYSPPSWEAVWTTLGFVAEYLQIYHMELESVVNTKEIHKVLRMQSSSSKECSFALRNNKI